MLAQYRKAFSPSGAKDDPTDAELALDLMLRYPNKIKALKMESEMYFHYRSNFKELTLV
jgi:hypothetical protein